MSQRRFTTAGSDGLTGGDRPRHSLCLVITARHTGESVDSHLSDERGRGLSPHGIRQGLAAFGIIPQAGRGDDLAADRRADAGKLRVVYDMA
jgi:hypothetical protein